MLWKYLLKYNYYLLNNIENNNSIEKRVDGLPTNSIYQDTN